MPDLKSQPLKMSSIVLASQLQPAKKGSNISPLVRDGSEIIPNVTHVFSSGQHLRLYYEVYDPARSANAPGSAPAGRAGASDNRTAANGKNAVRLLSSVSFFKGDAKAYETSPTEVQEISVPGWHAAVFQLDVPLSQLKPGFYTCQVYLIDDAAGHFVFPRVAMLLRQ